MSLPALWALCPHKYETAYTKVFRTLITTIHDDWVVHCISSLQGSLKSRSRKLKEVKIYIYIYIYSDNMNQTYRDVK